MRERAAVTARVARVVVKEAKQQLGEPTVTLQLDVEGGNDA
jgi:hypothetical protein